MVISTIRGLVLYEGVVDKDVPDLQHTEESRLKAYFRRKKLRKALKKAEKSFIRTENKIRRMIQTFDEFCPELKDTFDELNKEREAIKKELKRIEIEEGISPQEFEPCTAEEEEDLSREYDEEYLPDPLLEEEEAAKEKLIKRLYRKIAGKWGPGRASTEEEVSWFIEATNAYKRRDLEGVRFVYDILIYGKENCEYTEAVREIKNLEKDLDELELRKTTMLYPHLEIYRLFYRDAAGREMAQRAAKQVVEKKVCVLESIIASDKRRISELLARRKAREKTIVEDDPFDSVAPTVGFWQFL